jgi:hypothetical protein
MLFHFSFAAREPAHVATVVAELLGGTVIACPTPPFPAGSKYVCCGDDRGSMVEIVPAGFAYAPGPNARPRTVPTRTEPTASHALLLAGVPRERIDAIAAREGWPCGLVDTGLFKVISIWVEGTQLLELTTPELLPAYVATFGAAGLGKLDTELRAVEAHLAKLGHA